MNPATVAAAAVIVTLASSGAAAFACWRWGVARDEIRLLRDELVDERNASAAYRLWLDRPVDELRTDTTDNH